MAMQTITLSNGVEYGAENGTGVFSRPVASGQPWTQWTGTTQTPQFETPQQFRAYLRTHYDIRGARIVKTNW